MTEAQEFISISGRWIYRRNRHKARHERSLVLTMEWKRRVYFTLTVFVAAGLVFYTLRVASCSGYSCNLKIVPVVFGVTVPQSEVNVTYEAVHSSNGAVVATARAPIFQNDRQCGRNQTRIQNQHPRGPWTVREYPCKQLPEKLPKDVRCIPEAEFKTYTWNASNPKVKGDVN